jgi:hypothetical protein
MSLLRTACEVLERDAPIYWKRTLKEPNHCRLKHLNVKKRKWDQKSRWEPDIFGKFIYTDANLFLHEGKFTSGQSITVHLQGVSAQGVAAGEEPTEVLTSPPPQPPQTSYHMHTGPYAGCDALDLAQNAIAWLEGQIAIAKTKTP